MRKPIFLAAMVAAAVLIPRALPAQSLADVAREEEARRRAAKNPPAKVYTNEDLKPGVEPPAPPTAAASTAGASTGKPPAAATASDAKAAEVKAAEAKAAEAKKSEGGGAKDEKYWRDRITAARTALQRNNAFLSALQSQINGLYTEFVNMGDPAKRAVVEKKRLEAIAEQDRLKAEIEVQTKAITDIEDEARRAGAPSGWLR